MPMTRFVPDDADAVASIVGDAAATGDALSIGAGFTKASLGRPAQTPHVLDLSRLGGIVAHDAPELVLTAGAATPMPVIAASLDAAGQILAFEPPDWSTLLGADAGTDAGGRAPTIGGVLSCNLSGPRRVAAGASRDHLLGFDAVNGRGERFRAGGRVVKNVTGYDLPKLVCGAYGTLAVLTEVTLRLLPAPETERTIVIDGLSTADAQAAMAEALGSAHEASAAAHLPAPVAVRVGLRRDATAIRVEGNAPSVAFRADALHAIARGRGPVQIMEAASSRAFWRAVGDVSPLAKPADRAVWRLSVVPTRAPAIVDALGAALSFDHLLDWGGALLWCAVAPGPADAGAAAIRDAVARAGGGTATLVRASSALRAAVPVFDPLAPSALAALTARIKNSFDPHRILNPGRLHPGL